MKQHSEPGSADLMEHFLSLLRKFENATLITHTRECELHGRPMAISGVDDDGTIWFLTSADSPKIAEIADDSRVMITLQNDSQFVVARGRVQVVRDAKKLDELWKAADKVWFTGKDDPTLVMLAFFSEDAEFWDNAGARGLKFAYKAAKALVSGIPMADSEDPDTHAKLAV